MKVTTLDGTTYDLGKTEAKPTIGIVDYSRRETDAFGVTTVVKRPFSRRMSVKLGVPTARMDDNARLLTTLRAKSALWVADPRFAWLSVTGYYEDLSIDLPSGDLSYCTLTVAGLAEKETVADTGVEPSANGRASTLRFVQPVSVTDTVLVSSSVAESDAAGWSASATYPLGATVVRGHRIYESLAPGNVGADPVTEASKWLDTGPTNRWAMFDEALGSSTIAAAPVEFVLKAATAVSALALLDTNAAMVRVRAGGYDRTVVPDRAGKALFLDFAAAANASVTVTITPASANPGPQRWDDGAQWMDAGVWRDSLAAGDGTVTIGTFLFGAMKGLGTTETSPTAGITDYSVKETDEFGEVTVVERAWAKNMAVKAQIASSAVDVVANRIAAVRAQPALWIGDTVRDSLIVYGFFRDFSIEIGESVSKLSLSIEGLSKAAPIVPASTGSVAWPDITDPNGTKPTDNADKTSENTSKDTNAVGGVPAASITGRLDTLVNVTIPAVNQAVTDAGTRITAAKGAADAAKLRADAAFVEIGSQVTRVDQRIDAISASGGYDDTAVYAEVSRVDQAAIGRDVALGSRVDTVSANISDTDTNLRALVQTKEEAAVSRDDAISRRIDTLIAEGGGGSEGVDTVARAEVNRVEQTSITRDTAIGERIDTVKAGVDTVDSRIAASVSDVTRAYTDKDQALNERMNVMVSEYNGIGTSTNTRITQEVSALSAADVAATNRMDVMVSEYNGIGRDANARITQNFTTLSDASRAATSRMDVMVSEYNGIGATVTQQAGTLATVEGKTAAYVRVIADAGNGRASLSLWSDQYGGAWRLGGNGLIDGNLTINGTVTARAFNGASMVREASASWSGSITPGIGQVVMVPWSLTLPTIPAGLGRFIYEYYFYLTTNEGQTAPGGTDSRGRQITIHYVADGGGLVLNAVDAQGHVYAPRPNSSDRVLATTDYSPTFTAAVIRGSRNELEDGGDYVNRYVAATYTLMNISLKVTWVAI